MHQALSGIWCWRLGGRLCGARTCSAQSACAWSVREQQCASGVSRRESGERERESCVERKRERRFELARQRACAMRVNGAPVERRVTAHFRAPHLARLGYYSVCCIVHMIGFERKCACVYEILSASYLLTHSYLPDFTHSLVNIVRSVDLSGCLGTPDHADACPTFQCIISLNSMA